MSGVAAEHRKSQNSFGPGGLVPNFRNTYSSMIHVNDVGNVIIYCKALRIEFAF